MKQKEIRKCTKVVELFRSMMDELGDMCVVYDVRFGFIVLEYYMDGYFENNSNYDNVEDLGKGDLWNRQKSRQQTKNSVRISKRKSEELPTTWQFISAKQARKP